MNPKSITLLAGAGFGWFDLDQAIAITPFPKPKISTTPNHVGFVERNVLYLTDKCGYVLAVYHDGQWVSGEEIASRQAPMVWFQIMDEVPSLDPYQFPFENLYEVGSLEQLDAWRELVRQWEGLEV